MVGIIMLIVLICGYTYNGFKLSTRDMQRRGSSYDPYYMDSYGQMRTVKDNKKITTAYRDAENHAIIVDKHGKKIDYTWEEKKKLLDMTPGLIDIYGESLHRHDKVPGQRWVEKVGDKYVFYVVIWYKRAHFFADATTGKLVKPTMLENKINKICKQRNLMFYTDKDYQDIMDTYNAGLSYSEIKSSNPLWSDEVRWSHDKEFIETYIRNKRTPKERR